MGFHPASRVVPPSSHDAFIAGSPSSDFPRANGRGAVSRFTRSDGRSLAVSADWSQDSAPTKGNVMSHEMVWTKIHDEREALLAELEQLSDEQWRSPSLCEGWTIQDVVAHLASGASTSKADVAKLVLKHKGDFQAVIDAGVAEYSKGTPAETLAAFKAVLHERTAPLSGEAMLGDTLVHAEDIRRPLGLTREYPLETLRELGDYYKDSSGLGVKKRIDGLHLMATDQKWDHGKGEIVQGPLLALIMTMTGRAEYLDDLAGDGLPEYRARLTK